MAWHAERYRQLRVGGAERERNVETILRLHLIPYFAGPIPKDPREGREKVLQFLCAKTDGVSSRRAVLAGASTEFDRSVSAAEAATLTGCSISAIRRRLRASQFPGAYRHPSTGHWRIPVDDLDHLGVRAGRPLSRSYLRGILAIFRSVLQYGRALGYEVTDFTEGLTVPRPFDTEADPTGQPGTSPISIQDCVTIARGLHIVHQIVFWMQRVAGLRVSEAYGIRVGDVVDLGEVGILIIGRQGGRQFLQRTRTGHVAVTEKLTVKTAAGRRSVAIPRQLLEMLRVVIDSFHTDPLTGEPDQEARLVPGLAVDGVGGQGAYRSALKTALASIHRSAGVERALRG